jgi:putative aldouronate transport system substrate-binding protein
MKKLLYVLLILSLVLAFSTANGKDDASATTVTKTVAKKAPPEGAATNNGYPYNLTPVKYDSRDDKYLYGINATILPISDGSFTMEIWRNFSSTVMQGQDESEAFKAMEEATGVKIKWLYPPAGQATDNFNLRVSSNDLPHVFSNPPGYPGGPAKAIDDEVYVDLTPYYDQGMMPNVQYLRETREDINRDWVDDSGRIFKFPVLDIIPTDPWSGMWVREDWVKELGLDLPTTIADWDEMLYAMKKAYGIAPLGLNIDLWYGVRTNYAFAGSYESANEWMHRDGKAAYGPIEPGYKDFLTLLNKWYEDGILDPDFATRDQASYNALMANGGYGAMGMAYGDVGQAKRTGLSIDPDFKLTPVLQPTSYEGQVIHLHQDNSTVRTNANWVSVRSTDENVIEPVIKWLDFNYSQYGGDLCSYGPEGVSVEWEPNGEFKWIHPSLDNDEGLDFWTVYPLFKVHAWGSLRNSASYENEQEVWDCIELWDTQDSSWIMPDNISHTSEESRELANIMTDINTYRDEMTLKFIVGQEPIENFDNFVATIKKMNIDKAIEIKTAALTRYFAR